MEIEWRHVLVGALAGLCAVLAGALLAQVAHGDTWAPAEENQQGIVGRLEPLPITCTWRLFPGSEECVQARSVSPVSDVDGWQPECIDTYSPGDYAFTFEMPMARIVDGAEVEGAEVRLRAHAKRGCRGETSESVCVGSADLDSLACVVPEPPGAVLLLAGGLGLAAIGRGTRREGDRWTTTDDH